MVVFPQVTRIIGILWWLWPWIYGVLHQLNSRNCVHLTPWDFSQHAIWGWTVDLCWRCCGLPIHGKFTGESKFRGRKGWISWGFLEQIQVFLQLMCDHLGMVKIVGFATFSRHICGEWIKLQAYNVARDRYIQQGCSMLSTQLGFTWEYLSDSRMGCWAIDATNVHYLWLWSWWRKPTIGSTLR